jgi:hypothetical protein
MPMSAAFRWGNSCAVQVLLVLEFGASLDDPLKDLDFKDILECAGSFGKPNSEGTVSTTAVPASVTLQVRPVCPGHGLLSRRRSLLEQSQHR